MNIGAVYGDDTSARVEPIYEKRSCKYTISAGPYVDRVLLQLSTLYH